MIVRYTLENRATTSNAEVGLTTPECIDDGGQFMDTDGSIIGYCDDSKQLGVTCTEITEAELEERKARLANTHECAIRSDGQYSYIEALTDDINGFMVAKAYPSNAVVHYYTNGDSSCEFYSDRAEGRKKYWKGGNIPLDKYSQPDSDSQLLSYYSELVGVNQEWYYFFTTFDNMMSFVNENKPISLNQTLETKMRENPSSVKPNSIDNASYMYVASLSLSASGIKTTTVYVKAEPKDVFS
jgi:hypothetical protein